MTTETVRPPERNDESESGGAVSSVRLLCRPVAILFARPDSNYKTLDGVEVYDRERDAMTFNGGMPVVAHPPCRTWGAMSHFRHVTRDKSERQLAIWALGQVRRWGGVLEHPEASKLWKEMNLPNSGKDKWGGFTLWCDQLWWGHVANKRTKLYICGCDPADVPRMPLQIKLAAKTVAGIKGKPGHRCTQREREYTPIAFANWLVTTARLCRHNE